MMGATVSRKALTAAFNEVDEDNSGEIDVAEFKTMLEKLF